MQNFLKGKGRLMYSLNPDLEKGFSSPDTSLLSEDDNPTTEETCQRGCTSICKRLLPVFNDVGRHSAKFTLPMPRAILTPKSKILFIALLQVSYHIIATCKLCVDVESDQFLVVHNGGRLIMVYSCLLRISIIPTTTITF